MLTEEERLFCRRNTAKSETLHQWVLRVMPMIVKMNNDELSTWIFNVVKDSYLAGAASNVKGEKKRAEILNECMMWQYQAAKQVEDKEDDGKPMNRLDVYIEHTPMSVRTQNCLKRVGILTLGDLVQRTMRDIMNVRGLGQAGLFDIEEVLKTYGLQFRRNITLNS